MGDKPYFLVASLSSSPSAFLMKTPRFDSSRRSASALSNVFLKLNGERMFGISHFLDLLVQRSFGDRTNKLGILFPQDTDVIG